MPNNLNGSNTKHKYKIEKQVRCSISCTNVSQPFCPEDTLSCTIELIKIYAFRLQYFMISENQGYVLLRDLYIK